MINEDYDYDYHNLAEDADDIYDDVDDYDYDNYINSSWENYYHNITNEIIED